MTMIRTDNFSSMLDFEPGSQLVSDHDLLGVPQTGLTEIVIRAALRKRMDELRQPPGSPGFDQAVELAGQVREAAKRLLAERRSPSGKSRPAPLVRPAVFASPVVSSAIFSPPVAAPAVFAAPVVPSAILSPPVAAPAVFASPVASPAIFEPAATTPLVVAPTIVAPSSVRSRRTLSHSHRKAKPRRDRILPSSFVTLLFVVVGGGAGVVIALILVSYFRAGVTKSPKATPSLLPSLTDALSRDVIPSWTLESGSRDRGRFASCRFLSSETAWCCI